MNHLRKKTEQEEREEQKLAQLSYPIQVGLCLPVPPPPIMGKTTLSRQRRVGLGTHVSLQLASSHMVND